MEKIKLFDDKKCSRCNEIEKHWFSSIQDVIQILTESADVKQYIKRILNHKISTAK